MINVHLIQMFYCPLVCYETNALICYALPHVLPQEKKEVEEEVKPRKPVGAVSMFGGVDIAAAVKKRADSLSPEGKQDKGRFILDYNYKRFLLF